jgi:hypothetical protein
MPKRDCYYSDDESVSDSSSCYKCEKKQKSYCCEKCEKKHQQKRCEKQKKCEKCDICGSPKKPKYETPSNKDHACKDKKGQCIVISIN